MRCILPGHITATARITATEHNSFDHNSFDSAPADLEYRGMTRIRNRVRRELKEL